MRSGRRADLPVILPAARWLAPQPMRVWRSGWMRVAASLCSKAVARGHREARDGARRRLTIECSETWREHYYGDSYGVRDD
jgi:hypothetical protein